MVASAALTTGCMDGLQPMASADTDQAAIVDGHQIAALPVQGGIRYTHTADGDSIAVTSPGWTESSPGLWTSPDGNSGPTMIVGAAGHRAALVDGERRLAQLEHQAELGADLGTEIEQQSAYLGTLKHAEQEIAKMTGANALPAICNFSFYTGPSSPITGLSGATALATASCVQNCQVMTSTFAVCTNIVGCTQVQAQTSLVCGLAVRFGMSAVGSRGALCSAAVTMLPPGASTASPFLCG
jgi:hypothetical protein